MGKCKLALDFPHSYALSWAVSGNKVDVTRWKWGSNDVLLQVIQCVMDQNGNHVIQKVIEKVKPANLAFITEAIEKEKMVRFLMIGARNTGRCHCIIHPSLR